MPWSETVVFVVGTAVIGFGLLAVLWPGRGQGRRVLIRWGVDDPTDAEVTDAVGYLKRRRLWYPWMFFAVSALLSSRGESGGPAAVQTVLATLVLGGLLAEAVGQRPARGPRRVAGLVPRGVGNVLSVWSIVASAILAVAVLGVSMSALAGAVWARQLQPDPGPVLIAALVVVVLGAGIVWLAVRRPSGGEMRADNALRLRSVRVGVGLTMAALGGLFSAGASMAGQFAALVGVVCWIATVNPPREVRQAVVRA